MVKETKRAVYGMRIRFEDQGDNNLISVKMFSDGLKLVRVQLNRKEMLWSIFDAATGFVYLSGGEGISNFEVLQRNAKKALINFLNIPFEKERRKIAPSKYSLR